MKHGRRAAHVCRFRASEHGDAFPPPPICRGKHGRSVLGDGNTCGQVCARERTHQFSPIYLRCVVAKVFRKRGEKKKEKKINSERNAKFRSPLDLAEGSILARSIQLDRIAMLQCLHALFLLFRPSFRVNAIPFRACFWPRKDRRKFASSQRIFPRKKEGRRGFQFERAVPRNLRSSKTKKLGIGIRKFFSRCINLPLSLHFSDLPHSTLSIPLPSPSITLLAS